MVFEHAQADMRHAYFGGATGVMTSSLAWLAAALTAFLVSPRGAMAALFIGGIAVAIVASFQGTEWFFIAMLLTIGGRYLVFATCTGCGSTGSAAPRSPPPE